MNTESEQLLADISVGSLRSPGDIPLACSVSLRSTRRNCEKPQPADPMPRRRRTVHKLTRWHDDEWARVADAARERGGIPPLRFVREAALEAAAAGSAAPRHQPRQRRAGDELVHQLARVLNNLRQLQRVAEDDWDDDNARLIAEVIRTTEAATAAAPERAREANALLAELVPVGTALNDVAHTANAAEHLPPQVADVLVSLFSTLSPILR